MCSNGAGAQKISMGLGLGLGSRLAWFLAHLVKGEGWGLGLSDGIIQGMGQVLFGGG